MQRFGAHGFTLKHNADVVVISQPLIDGPPV